MAALPCLARTVPLAERTPRTCWCLCSARASRFVLWAANVLFAARLAAKLLHVGPEGQIGWTAVRSH
eukprot:8394662-Alexandrium_andersonii.AAC.1